MPLDYIGDSREIGEPCPKCGIALVRRSQIYCWQGKVHDAAWCKPCNAMWQIRGEEIEPLRNVKRRREN